MIIKNTVRSIATIIFFASLTYSCIETDNSMGSDLIPGDFYLSLHKAEFDVPLQMKTIDSLYTYYPDKLAFGSVRDKDFGLVEVSTAFKFIPDSSIYTASYGSNPEPISIIMELSQLSYPAYLPENEFIPQNIYVYKFTRDIDTVNTIYNNSISEDFYSPEPLNKGGTVIFGENGSGTEYFPLSLDFARELLEATEEERTDSATNYEAFRKRYKGLYIKTDPVQNFGGRINTIAFNDAMYYENVMIYLTYRHFDDDNPQGTDSTIAYKGYPQSVNDIRHSSAHLENENPQGKIFVEGLAGIKPYIDFGIMKENLENWAEEENIDLSKLIVTKAELRLPYENPSDYRLFNYFPGILHLNTVSRTENKIKLYNPVEDIYEITLDANGSPQSNNNRSQLYYSINLSSYLQKIIQEKYTGDQLKAWIAPEYAAVSYDSYSGGYTLSYFAMNKTSYYKVVLEGPNDERKPKLILTYALKN